MSRIINEVKGVNRVFSFEPQETPEGINFFKIHKKPRKA